MKLKTCENYSIYAYILMTYVLASVFYLLVTRFYGTPFKDAVKKHSDLMKIKMKSAEKRRNAFMIGILISIIVLTVCRPYGNIF